MGLIPRPPEGGASLSHPYQTWTMADQASGTLRVIEGTRNGNFLLTKPRTRWNQGDGNTPLRAVSQIPAGWTTVAVLAGNKDRHRYRFFTLKPSTEECTLLQPPEFEVRGRFAFETIVEDNPERALQLWSEFNPQGAASAGEKLPPQEGGRGVTQERRGLLWDAHGLQQEVKSLRAAKK